MSEGVAATTAFAAATAAHKLGDNELAASLYRQVLRETPTHAESCMLLANLLLSMPGSDESAKAANRTESLKLAETALKAVESMKDDYEKATMYARYAYYLLTRCNAFQHSEESTEDVGTAGTDLTAAVTALLTATKLAPSVVIAWKNLGLAYKLQHRFEDAETALAQAVRYSNAKNASILYSHAVALKRINKWEACIQRLCDVIALRKKDDLSEYWIRVLLTAHATEISGETKERVRSVFAAAGSTLEADASVPHEYIKRLFNGYANNFDKHLTGVLGYKTPKVLLDLALKHAGTAATSGILWNNCADLGCGTGLAGVEFRAHVKRLSGVDLSGGMVEEARKRALYDHLDVDELEKWLQSELKRIQAGGADGTAEAYDLVLAADVLVYIGPLEGVFSGVSSVMQAPTSASTPSTPVGKKLFIFSTEAETAGGAEEGTEAKFTGAGFRLTGTGRCVHQRGYVLHLASINGFRMIAVSRQAIRRNAGVDVMGDVFVLEHI